MQAQLHSEKEPAGLPALQSMVAPAKGSTTSKLPNSVHPPAKQWSELFKTISKPSSTFKLRKWQEDDRDIGQHELRNLGICLVAFILGRFPGWKAVEQVRKSWPVDSSCTMHETGWLIFRFNTEEDRDLVLHQGPYETEGATWILKELPAFFKFTEESFKTVPTWVRFYGLPLECWTANALGKIGSFVGEPIAADEGTAQMTKTAFARVLIEIQIGQPLVREVLISLPDGNKIKQSVTYEREPKWCSHCKRLNHTVTECRMRKEVPASEKRKSALPSQDKEQNVALPSSSQPTKVTSTPQTIEAAAPVPDELLNNAIPVMSELAAVIDVNEEEEEQTTPAHPQPIGRELNKENERTNPIPESLNQLDLQIGECSAPKDQLHAVDGTAEESEKRTDEDAVDTEKLPYEGATTRLQTSKKQKKKGKAKGGKGNAPIHSPS